MKQYLTLIILFLLIHPSFGQSNDPHEITPELLKKISTEVAKEASFFKTSILNNGLSPDAIEFAVDTFVIAHISSKRMEIDYTTFGMNITLEEMTNSYDKLLNKYYNKLLKMLLPEDKKILVSAQKSWINFRDAEGRLIWMLTKENYSGGGTMQSNIGTGACFDLVQKRTVELFNYYNAILR